MKSILRISFVLVVVALFSLTTMAQNVIPADKIVAGRSYSEWAAAWNQWATSIPVSNHPLFDNGDCNVGQSGPVWFLGGKFCSVGATNCGTANVVRSCTVPSNKGLFMPIIDSEQSVLEMNDPKTQIADMRKTIADAIDQAKDLAFEIDGVPVHNLKRDFRVLSPAFSFTLPDENFFNAVGEGPYLAGFYYPGVDDGVYVMLAPLAPGHHVVHFHGFMPQFNFTLDITYMLHVKR